MYAAGGDIELVEQSFRILLGDEPVTGAAVTIDQILTRYTGRDGLAHFTCLEPGEHLMIVELPGRISQLQMRIVTAGAEPIITVSAP